MSMDTHDHGELELALRALREEQGTLEQARALEQRLLDKLGERALLAPLAPAGSSIGRLSLLLGMAMLIGLGAFLGGPRHAPLPPAEPRAQVRVPLTVAPQAPALVPATTISAPAPPQVEPSIEPNVERAPRQPPRGEGPSLVTPRTPALPVVVAPREDELSMLQRAKAALRRSPETALSITEQHARDYPSGVFVQEREVLAIEALLKQRRADDALARAERFVTERPTSTYALQLREMLLTKPRVVAAALTLEPRGPAP
jgi:hypothetical protein